MRLVIFVIMCCFASLLLPACSHKVPVYSVKTPEFRTTLASRGDTLQTLAERENTTPKQLARLNNMNEPYTILEGQKINTAPVTATRESSDKLHTVSAGDTLYNIAGRYGTDVERVRARNNLKRDEPLFIGQKLTIPEGQGFSTQAEESSAMTAAKTQSIAYIANQPRAMRGLETGMNHFSWPIRGRLISTYGSKINGVYNDGINIEADRGMPVLAAEGGEVVHIGQSLESYGNLVLVRHKFDYITAYAHLEDVLVTKGQKIEKGQPVGTVGSSGSVSKPQVHFQIRRGKRSVDPLNHLS